MVKMLKLKILLFWSFLNFSLILGQQWSTINAKNEPTARKGASAVYYSGSVYLYGGYSSAFLNSIEAFSESSSSWRTYMPAVTGVASRAFQSAVVANNSMLVFGGNSNGSPLDDLFSVNLNTPLVTTITPTGTFATARYQHCAVFDPSSNSMFIFGGYNTSSPLGDLYSFNLLTNSSVSISSSGAPTGRYGMSCTLSGSLMIVFGGVGGMTGTTYYSDLYTYNIQTQVWSLLTTYNTPPARAFHGAGLKTIDIMVIFGGQLSGTSYDNSVYYLTLSASNFSQIAPTGTGPSSGMSQFAYTTISSIPGMFIFGGIQAGSLVNTLYTLNFNPPMYTTAVIPSVTGTSVTGSGLTGQSQTTAATITGNNQSTTQSASSGGTTSQNSSTSGDSRTQIFSLKLIWVIISYLLLI